MHQRDPAHYPDANHKPEMAIALTTFRALCQFRKRHLILTDIQRLPALAHFLLKPKTFVDEENKRKLKYAAA